MNLKSYRNIVKLMASTMEPFSRRLDVCLEKAKTMKKRL